MNTVHPFAPSGYTTLMTNRAICDKCGNLESFAVHRMPETPPEAREIDARKVGERA